MTGFVFLGNQAGSSAAVIINYGTPLQESSKHAYPPTGGKARHPK